MEKTSPKPNSKKQSLKQKVEKIFKLSDIEMRNELILNGTVNEHIIAYTMYPVEVQSIIKIDIDKFIKENRNELTFSSVHAYINYQFKKSLNNVGLPVLTNLYTLTEDNEHNDRKIYK